MNYELINDSRVICYEDSVYCKLLTLFSLACGLSHLSVSLKSKADFSGDWAFNEDKSVLDNMGVGNIPSLMRLTHSTN
jgi:hypothetical protein